MVRILSLFFKYLGVHLLRKDYTLRMVIWEEIFLFRERFFFSLGYSEAKVFKVTKSEPIPMQYKPMPT
jgi:hypothetical protein